MASNVQGFSSAQQTFVEEIDYNEIQELQVLIYMLCVTTIHSKLQIFPV